MLTVITPVHVPIVMQKYICTIKEELRAFEEQNPSITDDEEALYEFLEEADI